MGRQRSEVGWLVGGAGGLGVGELADACRFRGPSLRGSVRCCSTHLRPDWRSQASKAASKAAPAQPQPRTRRRLGQHGFDGHARLEVHVGGQLLQRVGEQRRDELIERGALAVDLQDGEGDRDGRGRIVLASRQAMPARAGSCRIPGQPLACLTVCVASSRRPATASLLPRPPSPFSSAVACASACSTVCSASPMRSLPCLGRGCGCGWMAGRQGREQAGRGPSRRRRKDGPV